MATSRTSIPASPTSVGATDDAALGGIFSRSNLANPISGADVNGVAINNSTITLNINGVEQAFTLNQSNSETLTYTVAGGTGTGVDPNAFTSASISGNVITLTTQGGTAVPITLPTQTGGGDPLTALTYDSAARTFTATLTTGAPIVSAPITGFVTGITVGGVAQNENAAGVVNIPALGITVNNDATSALIVSTSTVDIGGTRYGLTYNTSTDTIAFASMGVTPPTPTGGSTTTFTAMSGSALAAPTAPTASITPDAGDTITSVQATLTGGPTNTNITLDSTMTSQPNGGSATVAPGGTGASISFPDSTGTGALDYSEEGTYTLTTTTMVSFDNNGTPDTQTVTMTDTFMRFLPFFQSRTDLTTAMEITAASASTARFNNTITAIAGGGLLYYAVPMARLASTPSPRNVATGNGFPIRLTFLRTVTVQGADGTDEMYNVFASPANAGVVINFT